MPRVSVYGVHGEDPIVHVLERRLTFGGDAASVDVYLPGLRPVHAWLDVEDGTVVRYAFGSAPTHLDLTAPQAEPAIERHPLDSPTAKFWLDGYTVIVEDIPGLRNYAPRDATEAELVAGLRANPLDEATRDVYADWLEQHGHGLRAKLLRAETAAARAGAELVVRLDHLAPHGDEAWRAVASRPAIDGCEPVRFNFRCPVTWSALTVTADDRVRNCSACAREVHYCTSIEEARAHGRAVPSRCIAIDAAVARGDAVTAYTDAAAGEEWMGEVAHEPGDIYEGLEPLTWGPGRCGGPDVDD